MEPISPFPKGTLELPSDVPALPKTSRRYWLFAWSFAWVPVAFISLSYITAKLHLPMGVGFFVLFATAIYLLLAAVLVTGAKQKTRWLFALLNLAAAAVTLWWLGLAFTFSGGIYK